MDCTFSRAVVVAAGSVPQRVKSHSARELQTAFSRLREVASFGSLRSLAAAGCVFLGGARIHRSDYGIQAIKVDFERRDANSHD